MTTVALVLSSLALAASLTVAGFLVVLMRQSSDTTSKLRRHRIAHQTAEGFADPMPEKEPAHPPRGASRYEPPTGTMPALTAEQLADPELDTVESPAARPQPLRGVSE
jgi:hypothetical protein